jgi:hypothetical protein
MATVNFIKCKHQNKASMRGTIEYIMQDYKVDYNGVHLASGKDCCPESAYNEFMATKQSYDKADGVFFYHYTQSFHPNENLTPQKAHKIALKFAEDNYPDHEVLVATHMDKSHIHSHFVINSVSFKSGKKLHQGTDTIQKLRQYSDKLCQSYGLSILEPYKKERVKQPNRREYRTAIRGESWKFELIRAIDDAIECSHDRESFIKNMEYEGYAVKWTDERKNITYTCPNGMKCRDNKLFDETYLKANMEIIFELKAAFAPQSRTPEPQGGWLNWANAILDAADAATSSDYEPHNFKPRYKLDRKVLRHEAIKKLAMGHKLPSEQSQGQNYEQGLH